MKNIYKKDEDRITISEVKRLIKTASSEENFVDIYVGLDADGIEIPDCIEAVQQLAGRYDVSLESDFLGICKQLKIQPRSFWRPSLTDFTASHYQDETYAITHDEFVHLVNFYGSKVIIGVEPKRIVIPEGQSAADVSTYAHSWYDGILNAASWWVAEDVTAEEAALLLCEFDPLKVTADDASKVTTSQTDSEDFLVLRRAFEGISRTNREHRSINQWRLLAVERGLKYHSWIDDYAVVEETRGSAAHESQLGQINCRAPVVCNLVERTTVISDPPTTQIQRLDVQVGLSQAAETTEERQSRRYQMCIDANLEMPIDDYAYLPRGIGKLAQIEKIKRQSFSEDVKAHIRRKIGR